MQDEIKQVHGDQDQGLSCEDVSRELDAQFGSSRPKLSPAAQTHLDSCPACRGLHTWITGVDVDLSSPNSESPSHVPNPARNHGSQRIVGELTSDLKPVKPLPSVLCSTLQFLGVFVLLMAGLVAMWTLRGLIHPPVWQVVVMFAVCLAGASLVAISLARQMRPAARPVLPERSLMIVLGAILLGGVALLFPWNQLGAGAVSSSTFFAQSWSCFWPGVTMAVPVAVLLWMVARRGVSYSLTGAGAALGALGGLFALAALSLSCANHDALHLLVSHVGVLAASAVTGALIGRLASRFSGHPSSNAHRAA